MPIEKQQVYAQAKATVDTLSSMTAKQKETRPTVNYAESYNGLLALAKEAAPQVDQRLWPPQLEVFEAMGGILAVNTHYGEIETYARRIMELIKPAPGVPYVHNR